MVVSRTFIADEVRGAHEHLRDLTVIESVGTAIDGHDGIAVAGLIINGLPITEYIVDFRGGEKGDREEADRKDKTSHMHANESKTAAKVVKILHIRK